MPPPSPSSFISLTLLFLLPSIFYAYSNNVEHSIGADKTLAIVDPVYSTAQRFSDYFNDLQGDGHELTIVPSTSSTIVIKEFGEYLYDNIIIFAPKTSSFNSLSFHDLLSFVDHGGNLVLGLEGGMSKNMRLFAENCGIEFDSKTSEVIDHFNYYRSNISIGGDVSHNTVMASNVIKSEAVLGEFSHNAHLAPVLYRGLGHAVEEDNVLAVKVLRGNPTSYSSDRAKDISSFPDNAGSDTLLVTGIQARNNARVLVSGSLDMFSNEFFRAEDGRYGNRVFCREVTRWTTGKAGVLRFSNITHYRSDGSPADLILHEKKRPDLPTTLYPDPELTRSSLVYRVKDEIVFGITLQELKQGKWVPFAPTDLQLEFVMLDPYIRTTMNCDPQTGRCHASFIAPDDYGVFKFRVLYRRSGYSTIHTETQVSIRPFKHNEYERFIPSAYPYYTSAFAVMIGFLAFSVSFYFSSD